MPDKNYHHGDLKNALIKAGGEILSKEGVAGLSLRKVAKRAGVSHSAPYAHFPDKQSLIAAISTEGFKQLYAELDAAVSLHAGDPKRQLQEGAWAYVQFALHNTDTFKIMFSGVLEKEREYPAFVEISHKTFERVVDVVQACQDADILRSGPPEVMAVAVWGQVHGIISLMLEGQISHAVLDRFNIREIVFVALGQIFIAQVVSKWTAINVGVAWLAAILIQFGVRRSKREKQENDYKHGYISDLAIDKSFEGRGIGRMLLETAETWFRSMGYRLLTLYVFAGNDHARRVYEKHGFSQEVVKYVKALR